MKQFFFSQRECLKDYGLLILRIGIGAIFVRHGYLKMMAGTEKWLWLGSKMAYFGITVFPSFWGFLAASSEFFGGLCLIVGLCTRIASFFMASTMFVAVVHHLMQGDGFSGTAHALSLLIVFTSICMSGPGPYSIDYFICKKEQ